MKQWFPFSDYDFYAYLTAGLTLLFALDLTFLDGQVFLRSQWTVIQVVLVLALAYIVGQVVAIPSSLLFEHCLARKVLRPPMTVQLSLLPLRRRERLVFAMEGRNYGPLPARIREKVLVAAKVRLGGKSDPSQEEVFQVAYLMCRAIFRAYPPAQ